VFEIGNQLMSDIVGPRNEIPRMTTLRSK